jgi:ribonuclease HII
MEKPLILRAGAVKKLHKNHYETLYWQKGSLVCGIDEAGRGPLAGPLVTAAAMVPIHTTYRNLKDSKCMTPLERERAFTWIRAHGWYAVSIIPVHIIDAINIWQATLLGMRRAILQLMSIAPIKPDAFLVDAMPLSLTKCAYETIPVHAFVFGESLSCSVAAASIVAKVTRDRIMQQTDALFPLYNFKQHKGYGTTEHRDHIKNNNRSLAHRIEYLSSITMNSLEECSGYYQQELC